MQPIISLKNVSVKYRIISEKPKTLQEYIIQRFKGKKNRQNNIIALNAINLEIIKGESIGIIGRNGAGKSTLLKVIAGILIPTEGEVKISGKISPLIELGAGFDYELTGKENIYLNASLLGLSKKEIDSKFSSIVNFSELGDFIHSPLKNYSTGMISKLGFSIATEVSPDILIIDEILAVGDEHFKKKCMNRIMGFKQSGVNILFVSHSMSEIKLLCNKVLWLDKGNIRMFDEPHLVTESYLKESV